MNQLEELATEMKRILLAHNSWSDTRIYFNNKAFCSNEGVIENIDPMDFVSQGDPSTIIMTFQGPLYDYMNYGGNQQILDLLERLFEKYGYFYEQGHAWSLSLYSI